MAQQETIGLDAFNTSLHGRRILCQGPFTSHPPIMEAIQHLREPFQKRILLTRSAFGICRALPMAFDAIFSISNPADWPLAVTYMTYCAKPLLIVAEDLPIHDGLWPKLTRSMTLVHFLSTPAVSVRAYDAIFFPLMETMTAAQSEYALKILQGVYRSSYSYAEHKEIMQELRVAGAGLVWCNVGTSGLYWYDPVSPSARERMPHGQVAEILGILAEQFRE